MDNKELLALLEKAGITTQNTGGLLNTEQATKFIDTVVDQSAFLKSIRIEKNIARARDLDYMGAASRLFHKATENENPADGRIKTVTTGKQTLTPVEIMLPYNISLSYLEENIEKEGVENTINAIFAKQFANDLVDGFFNCDTAILEADPDYYFLVALNGILKKLSVDADKQVYARAADDTDWKGSVFPSVLAMLPDKYQDDPNLVLVTSRQTDNEYRDQLAEKNTQLGDTMLVQKPKTFFKGIPLEVVPGVPYGTNIITAKENLAVGFGRDMTVYRMLVPRARRIEYTITAKVDYGYVLTEKIAYCR
jgi:hypothetical protein